MYNKIIYLGYLDITNKIILKLQLKITKNFKLKYTVYDDLFILLNVYFRKI
jgi:hypothetical protein